MIQDSFKKYLDQKDVTKTLRADLKDAMQTHELYPEIEELAKQLKRKRDDLKAVTEIALIKEKLDGAKDKEDLLRDILEAEMAEAGEQEVTYNGKTAKMITKVKFEKATT